MINKDLSIIVTNHNRCPMLNYVLDTLIETNMYSNVELILIDDCSEQPIQKLEYYKGFIKYYRNDKNMNKIINSLSHAGYIHELWEEK